MVLVPHRHLLLRWPPLALHRHAHPFLCGPQILLLPFRKHASNRLLLQLPPALRRSSPTPCSGLIAGAVCVCVCLRCRAGSVGRTGQSSPFQFACSAARTPWSGRWRPAQTPRQFGASLGARGDPGCGALVIAGCVAFLRGGPRAIARQVKFFGICAPPSVRRHRGARETTASHGPGHRCNARAGSSRTRAGAGG